MAQTSISNLPTPSHAVTAHSSGRRRGGPASGCRMDMARAFGNYRYSGGTKVTTPDALHICGARGRDFCPLTVHVQGRTSRISGIVPKARYDLESIPELALTQQLGLTLFISIATCLSNTSDGRRMSPESYPAPRNSCRVDGQHVGDKEKTSETSPCL